MRVSNHPAMGSLLPNLRSAARSVAIVVACTASLGLVSVPANAGTPCRTSGSSYTVTVCFTEPADGAALTGVRTVTTTLTVNGTNPGVQKLLYYLGGDYLLTDYSAPYTFTLPTDRFVDGPRKLEVEASMRDGFTTQRSSVDVNFVNGVTEPPINTNTFTPAAGTTPAPGRPFILAAAGDGASGRPDAQAVTDLISSWSPNMFLYLGDVYDRGTATEFSNWYGTPDRFFGRFRGISNPTVGNHEYLTPNAAGYFGYWDNVPHHFSLNVAGWHIVSLDSTGSFAQTTPGSPQYQWLDQDLGSSSAACTIVFFHHPRWSVGQTADAGDTARITDLWSLFAQRGVDLVLNGHDHNYQRWQPLDAAGKVNPSAPTEIVVGSGGHGIQPFSRTDSRMVTGFDTVADFGALKLELNQHGAAYQFINTAGSTRDSGSVRCSGTPADTTVPEAPTNLAATSPAADKVDLTWTSSTDNVGVTGYDIYRNGSFLTTAGPAPAYTDAIVAGGITYEYLVRARDAAGNVSGPSNTATVTTQGTSPPLFTDDFETGNFSKWTSNTGLVTQQEEVFAGSWAARGTTTSAATWAYKILGSTHSELHYRARFKVLSQGSSSTVNLLKLRTGTGASILGLFRNTTGKLGYRNEVTGVSTTSSTTITAGAWHEVQIRVRINGASGESETWFDGVRIASLSKTENFGTTALGRIQLGENSTGRTFDITFDDVAAATSFISGGGPPADTTPPTSPTNLTAEAPTSDRVDLTWTASTDNVGVTAYDIYRNDALLTSTGPTATYSDTTVASGTTYSYFVKARDAARNVSGPSNSASVTTPGTAPLVFTDGFETGNFSKWTANTGLVAQQQEVLSGAWAARGTSAGSANWAYAQLGSTYGELFYRIRFKVLSQGAASNNSVNLLKLRTGTGGAILGLYRNPQGRLGYRNEIAALSTTSSTTITAGTWHEVQIRARINGASGESETWFDGVRIAALSKTENFGTNPIGRIQLGENAPSRNYDIAFDDVVAHTSFISDGGPPPDTTPPTDPTNLNAVAVSPTRVDLSWTASTDNVGVTNYDIYRNGSPLTSVGAVTTYSDTTAAPSTTYSYEVRAKDAAGNPSGFSNTSTVTTPAAPSVLTFTPTDDASIRADQPGTNFGTQGAIGVDSSPVKHYLMKFDISGIGARTVMSAKLRLSCIDSSDSGGIFYRVLDPNAWTEGSVTWNSSPAADTTQLTTLGSVSATRSYEVDLTSLITGDGVVSVRVVSNSASGNGADFSSKEGSAPPQLVVTLA
jgi:chitodextrinase